MTTAKPPALALDATTQSFRLELDIRALGMTTEQFLQLCADNKELQMELTAKGDLIIMPPTWSTTGWRNGYLTADLVNWARRDGTGMAFDSNAGFTLPNGAVRAPDASWILLSRWEALSAAEQRGYARICPDFVIELRSQSDRLSDVQAKMAEYLENGIRLGWLLDPRNRQAHIYRPMRPVEILTEPATVSGDPELPGFTLDLAAIW